MRRYAARLSCAFFLIGFSVTACPQGNETIEYQPEKVRHLAGVVTYATGETIPGVVVEDCDSDFKHVLRSVTTDARGTFSFSNVKYGSKQNLNVRCPNYDFDHHIVTISLFGKARLIIRLYPGT